MIRMNLRQIAAFRAVVQTGSMTEAGSVLGVSQPAVSRLIRDFEEQFGQQLFRRRAGRIEPTKDAIALHQEVERCFADLEQVLEFANNLKEFRKQRLRIASTVGHSYFFLPKVIERFHKRYPEATISLRSGTSNEVVDLIEKGQSDIGLAILPLDVHGVVLKEVEVANLVCVMPKDHALTALETIRPKDLKDVPLLLVSENSLMRKRLRQAFVDNEIRPNVIIDSTYTGPICSLVAAGMGVSVMDILTAQAYADQNIAIRPFEPAIPCELKLVLPAGQTSSKLTEAFIGVMNELVVEAYQ